MSDNPVLLEREGDVAYLTLNRPEVGNTVNMALARAFLAKAIEVESDPAVRCVVLRAEGKLFCGGGDIAGFKEAAGRRDAYLSELADTVHFGLFKLMRMQKPLVVLVNGPAAGAGMGLALIGDVVLASDKASFTAAYGLVGLSTDGGVSWLLPRLVGLRKAQSMLMLNETVKAQEAEHIGLVTRVVPHDQLAEEGKKVSERLAASAIGAIGKTRSLLLHSYEDSYEGHLSMETRLIAQAGASPECDEGVAAFLEKRKPDFRNPD